MSAGTRDHRDTPVKPTLKEMNKRGLKLLEAHLRSFDPGEPTAHDVLEEELGEALTRQLLFALGPNALPPGRNVLAA